MSVPIIHRVHAHSDTGIGLRFSAAFRTNKAARTSAATQSPGLTCNAEVERHMALIPVTGAVRLLQAVGAL